MPSLVLNQINSDYIEKDTVFRIAARVILRSRARGNNIYIHVNISSEGGYLGKDIQHKHFSSIDKPTITMQPSSFHGNFLGLLWID